MKEIKRVPVFLKHSVVKFYYFFVYSLFISCLPNTVNKDVCV